MARQCAQRNGNGVRCRKPARHKSPHTFGYTALEFLRAIIPPEERKG